MSDDKERLAAWMMKEGFATGHGDTAEELLEELSWQIAEIKAQRDELLEALEMGYADTMEYVRLNHLSGAEDKHWLQLARAAILKAKGESNE